MSLNAATIEILLSKGLTGADLLEVARAMEADKPRSSGAVRQARYRKNRAESVTSDVTGDVTNPLKDNSKPLSDPDGSADKPRDLVKEVFEVGVDLLTSQGLNAGRARSVVGKWREGGKRDTEIAAAFIEAKQRGISNLVEWMPRRLNGTGRRGTDPPSYLEYLTSQSGANQ